MSDTDHQHLASFLEMMSAERGAAANTLDAYRRDLDHLLAFLAGRDRTLDHTTQADLQAYLADLAQRGMATSSRARKLSSLRHFFKFLHAEETIDENPAERLGGPQRERPLPKTLTVAEVDHLLTTARARSGMAGENRRSALRFYCLFEVLYATGLRVSELVALDSQRPKVV